MSGWCVFLNGICKAFYAREHRRFIASCDISKVQRDYLGKLMRRNADTVYGRRYGFADIRYYEDYAGKVPLTVYDDYEPYIDEIAKGAKRVLTAEDVILMELTSGSSGGKKLIPYTRTLKDEFLRGIKPWLYDIYSKVDGVDRGRSYWSITPVTAGRSYTESGIPIGFEEDSAYFGAVLKSVMDKLFAVGSDVKFVSDMKDFYTKTALGLIRCDSLTLISVWNPTFLAILCDFISDNAEELARQLDMENAKRLREAIDANRFDILFPELRIISCWADGSAADYIGDIRARFPDVYIQPKGLLATECFASFPLVGEDGSRLSIYSHFFEFKSMADGRICTVDGLSKGEYELIVTTGGGFYRYRIGDIIEVLETYPDRPPRIRFLRRGGISSDLFGEKLTEEFVRGVCASLGISGNFCLLAPDGKRYCLYTDADGVTDNMLDAALRESYHYDYCRSLGQLEAAHVVRVAGNPKGAYIQRLAADGMRIGDIKPAYLSPKDGWQKWFERKATVC